MASLDDFKPEMDIANLYSEEVVTDRKVGTIRILNPITPEGQRDTTRPLVFLGEAQIMTQMGPLPINFEIPAATLREAVEKYGEAANQGVKDTMERIREYQRQQASQIVTPDMPGFQAPPQPGGSGIVMP